MTLVVDSFHDSYEAAVAAIRQEAFSRCGPAIYVLPPAAVHGSWQSWQQGRAGEHQDLEKLPSAHPHSRLPLFGLESDRLAQGRRPVDRRHAPHGGMGKAQDFYATVHQRNVPQLDTFFLPPLLEALGLSWGDRSAWHDSWLEDVPSSNGSNPSELASTPHPPESNEPPAHAQPQPVEQEEASNNLATDRKVAVEAVVATPRAHAPASSDYCDFHQCERIVCLCWD